MDPIELDLSNHCIETELKRVHNRALSDYFRAGGGENSVVTLEETIRWTQKALESLNFAYLRSTYPPLAGHGNSRVSLVEIEDRISILIDGKKIQTDKGTP